MGPTGDAERPAEYGAQDDYDQSLLAAREAFPDWDLHEVLGGFIAVPAGTPVIRGMFVATVVEKLRARSAG